MIQDYQEPASVADFVAEVGVDPATGLDRAAAMTRRDLYGANRVTPPVNCPSWVCCLLPCLLRTASMQAFNASLPRESTVRRRITSIDGKPATRRMRMDAMSLVYGDVVELAAGDVVGADLRVVESSDDCVVDQSVLVGDDQDEDEEQGEQRSRKRVTAASPSVGARQDPLVCGNILLMATRVVQGSAVAVVVSTGDHTLWGEMVSQHAWPLSTSSRRRAPEEQGLIV